MKTIVGLLLIALLSQCTTWQRVYLTVKGEANPRMILEKEVAYFINIPNYTPEMKSGDLFLKINLPGIPLNEENLSFCKISGKEFIGSTTEIDKAYLFSKLVDRLLLVGAYSGENGSSLSNYYINGSKTALNKLPDNFPPSPLNSARYDEFYLTILNPTQFAKDSTWTTFEKNVTKLDSFKVGETSFQVVVPLYNYSMTIRSLKVERPWFNLDYALQKSNNSGSSVSYGRVAYVEGIIFARNIKLENFSQSKSEITISKNGNRQKAVHSSPTNTIETLDSVIIGYVYRLL